jgi:hypothetical protein
MKPVHILSYYIKSILIPFSLLHLSLPKLFPSGFTPKHHVLCTAPPWPKIILTIHPHSMCMLGASNFCSKGQEPLFVGWSTRQMWKKKKWYTVYLTTKLLCSLYSIHNTYQRDHGPWVGHPWCRSFHPSLRHFVTYCNMLL